ncbi:MAG TPA: helix-turn-helix domain-containing protein [Ramlibacter sp.]|uniref:sigma-54-dependent Fis family transcriptional regulator n=1 Tax=Ramlibacter sp. TaxID=1917967 RepID=UPI002D800008|nr:helix-turn-helix domain-containing protein [Ramlibacter sp.]HET8747786.1 helix-turn-helix domain-containing protein [Ramlibacter sp.]
MNVAGTTAAHERLQQIERVRRAVLEEGRALTDVLVHAWYERAWIERSWRRCLQSGQRPQDRVGFDLVSQQHMRRVEEANHTLVAAARPVLEQLGRAIASTRYFAVLTNDEGMVVDAHGPIDLGDPRAQVIARIGADLSERAVGTTAIGAALSELQPVWLHRGEHFFEDTSCYSCAGAPLFGPDGHCVGMLDLTGIDAAERPELKHLVAQSARSIENALALSRPHKLVLRLNWPGRLLGDDDDGIVCLDRDGWVTGSNGAARQLLAGLAQAAHGPVHCSELFAQPWEPLYDLARASEHTPVEVPLWSGLRLACLAQPAGGARAGGARLPLRDVEIALIRKAVNDARGNVMEAARALGISRATVYRKLAQKAAERN